MENSWCRSVPLIVLAASASCLVAQAPDPDHIGEVSGRIIDELEAPVPAAKVTVLDDGRRIVRGVMSDGSGAFLVKGMTLRAEGLTLRIEAKGFAAAERYVQLRWFDSAAAVSVRLRSSDTVRGRVVDQAGAPVAHADVVWAPRVEADATVSTWASADAEGRFILRDVPLGDGCIVVIGEGLVASETPARAPCADEVRIVIARGLGPTLRIRLKGVADEAARAFSARVVVWFSDARLAIALPVQALTGCDTIVHGLLPGADAHVRLSGKDPFGGDTMVMNASGNREPDKNLPQIDIVFRIPEAGELTGRVVGVDGKPCPGVHLKVRDGATMFGALGVTDNGGEFRMRRPSAPLAVLQVFSVEAGWVFESSGDGSAQTGHDMWGIVAARADGKPLAVEARRAATIRGRVLDAAGSGLAGTAVLVCPDVEPASGMLSSIWSGTTDADGSFCFPRHRATDQALRVRLGSSSSARGQSASFSLKSGETKDIELRAPDAVVHRGTVVDAAGKPMPGAGVEIAAADGCRETVFTDRTGRFAFTTAWLGDEVRAELRDGGTVVSHDVQVKRDGKQRVWSIRVTK